MDLKSKGRTWVGNIYHKFEAICHEVDEFVTKDPAKYLENQVQTVNESVKRIYSNVLHDFDPILGDTIETKPQAVTRKQDDAIGASIRSMVGVKEQPTNFSEMQLSEELDPVNLRNCNTSEVESLRQFSVSPHVDFPEDEENGSHWEEGCDAAFPKTTMAVEKDVGVEDHWEAGHLSCSEDANSCELLLHSREQHLLTKNVDSPVGRNLSLPLDMSNSQDKRSTVLADSPRSVIEDVELTQKEETNCNSTSLSERVETGFSSEQVDDTPIFQNSEMGVEENAMIVAHPACETVSCLEDRNLNQFLWVNKHLPWANDLCSPEAKILSLSSSADEGHKYAVLPEIVVPDERMSLSMTETMEDYADLSEKVKTNLSFDQGDLGLEVSVTKEHLLVGSGRVPNYRNSSELSLILREQYLLTEESSSVKYESLPTTPLISTIENSKVTDVDKFLPAPSVSGEWLGVLEDEEGVFSGTHFSGEAVADLSFDSYHSCMLSELVLEEKGLVQKHELMDHLGDSKDSCNLSLHSRGLHLGIDGFTSPRFENSSNSSLISGAGECTTTIAVNFLPITTVHNSVLRHIHRNDEATYAVFSDHLGSSNAPSDLLSSNVSRAHHVVQSEASSSSLPTEISHANYIEKTEKMCSDYYHASCSASNLSTMSYASSFDLGSNDKTGNQIPTFSRTASSPVGFFQEILDDSSADIEDANLETINLSDKANLEESCSIVDKELLYTPSFSCRKFRSYKELIKEAFASRKRLVKEYKQLPIWYGDFDTETSLLSEKHLSPHKALSSASAPPSTLTLTSSDPCNISELDWELL